MTNQHKATSCKYFYILSDPPRLHRSIFKIGITLSDNTRKLESRYGTYLENVKILALISTTYCDVRDAESKIKRELKDYRLDNNLSNKTEWLHIDYDDLLTICKVVLMGREVGDLSYLRKPEDIDISNIDLLTIPEQYRSINVEGPTKVEDIISHPLCDADYIEVGISSINSRYLIPRNNIPMLIRWLEYNDGKIVNTTLKPKVPPMIGEMMLLPLKDASF